MVRPGIELAGKRVLVLGLARTGIATAQFCAARGALVTAADDRPAEQFGEAMAQLRPFGCTLRFGAASAASGDSAWAALASQDLVVPSPGVPANHPGLAAARAAGVPVWSEIELGWRFLRGRLVCITGSNGKTTTTSLVGHILETAGLPAVVAGNIGTPLIA